MGCFSAPSVFKSVRRRSLAQNNTRTVPIGITGSETTQGFPNNMVITSKYTVWNFLPKNLFGQFRRIANFYFLCIAVVQMSINSPVSPATSLVPLVFVVVVTAVKQAYEDWLRHKADTAVNMQLVRVVREGKLQRIHAQDIKVGDIVMVKSEEEFPCDLVLLSSSDSQGRCHITTANLDGETNLKMHECLRETRLLQSMSQLGRLTASIECQQPTPDLYKFLGRMTVCPDGEQVPCLRSLGPTNLLLKGARLKNTAFVYGCAVYTGEQTKMVLNLKLTSNKFSTVEKSMNEFLMVFLILLLVETSVATALLYAFREDFTAAWYLPTETKATGLGVFADFLAFVVLFNYIIPISLYVTLEMVKFVGAMFFAWDKELYDPESGEFARCNTSDLNEELGQVEYLFTDKTGTLTENDMQFRQCSIDGLRYTEHGGMLCQLPDSLHTQPDPVLHFTDEQEHFLLALAICNTIQVDRKSNSNGANGYCTSTSPTEASLSNGHGPKSPTQSNELPFPNEDLEEILYQASSPDEKALVEACRRFGVVLCDICDDTYEVRFKGKLRTYKRLHVLEFDSDRKKMSVVIQDENGHIQLLCKGAESSVLQNTVAGPMDITLQHVNGYAIAGLRTLVLAYKRMPPEEYRSFNKALLAARNSLVDREQAVSAVFDSVEQNLTVLGATAVEDRLQDGVPMTLEALRAAGIKVWVLTGDKHETAINISYSCGHIKRGMTQLTLIHQTTTQECLCSLEQIKNRMNSEPLASYALVVDGPSLIFALQEHKELLSSVARACSAVLCCRMSPLQKAQVVTMIKNHPSCPITAAIGDGANDVSMIQEAHVGLGIMGKEGRQAVRCADFAFARFRFLQRVFLVHGHYYYVRVATLVQYFFYKNIAFITPQVIYTFFSAYSAQPLYHSVYLMFFNLFFSSLPVLVYGLSEQNMPQKTLIDRPDLYKSNARNSLLTKSQFLKWLLQGFYHALVAFFGVMLFWRDDVPFLQSGQILDHACFGTLIYQIVVYVVNFKLMLVTRYCTGLFLGSITISVLGFESFSFLYSSFMWPLQDNVMFYVYIKLSSSGTFWFLFVLLCTIALLPDFLWLMLENNVGKIGRILKSVRASCLKPPSLQPLSMHYSSRPPDVTVFHITVQPTERSF